MSQPIDDGGPSKDMTLRDWFAGQALVGLLAKLPVIDQTGEFGVKVDDKHAYNFDVADSCYQIADAMLKARRGSDEPVAEPPKERVCRWRYSKYRGRHERGCDNGTTYIDRPNFCPECGGNVEVES